MHTFFINTSKKSLQDYAVLFDVYEANKTFLPLECPMEDWLDLQAGYRACLQKMGELIDGYAEIDDTFNLVLYVDLLEHPVYAAIARAQEEDVQRNAVQQAMQLLLTRWLSKTLLSALVTAGRRPQEVLLMVGTDKRMQTVSVPMMPRAKMQLTKSCMRYWACLRKSRSLHAPKS